MRKKQIQGLLRGNVLLILLMISCNHHVSPSGQAAAMKGSVLVSSPPCIIYRTRSDYSMHVPVMLSPEKDRIVSYPGIKDIYYNGRLSVPTLLDSGFLLDYRGIGLQVAFLDYTYEEYSRLSATPPATDLMSLLMDKDPLVEMYQCRFRNNYTDIVQELNVIIRSGKLSTCRKLK